MKDSFKLNNENQAVVSLLEQNPYHDFICFEEMDDVGRLGRRGNGGKWLGFRRESWEHK